MPVSKVDFQPDGNSRTTLRTAPSQGPQCTGIVKINMTSSKRRWENMPSAAASKLTWPAEFGWGPALELNRQFGFLRVRMELNVGFREQWNDDVDCPVAIRTRTLTEPEATIPPHPRRPHPYPTCGRINIQPQSRPRRPRGVDQTVPWRRLGRCPRWGTSVAVR